jgi:hypothetical protein
MGLASRHEYVNFLYSTIDIRFTRALERIITNSDIHIRGPFEKFVGSPYYSEPELCGGAVTVYFSKYLLWQAMHVLQRSTHFSKTELRSF